MKFKGSPEGNAANNLQIPKSTVYSVLHKIFAVYSRFICKTMRNIYSFPHSFWIV